MGLINLKNDFTAQNSEMRLINFCQNMLHLLQPHVIKAEKETRSG